MDDFFDTLLGPKNDDGIPIWGYHIYLTYDQDTSDYKTHDTTLVTKMNPGFRLNAIALPGASLAEVRSHFLANIRRKSDDYGIIEEESSGLREDVVFVIDDEAFQSVVAGPEPLIDLPDHEGPDRKFFDETIKVNKESDVFIKAVEVDYTAGEEGMVHMSRSRPGGRSGHRGGGPVWRGVVKVSPRAIKKLCEEIEADCFIYLFEGDDNAIWGA